MRKTNIIAVLKMVQQYLDGEMDYISFTLDFPYEVQTRYEIMQKENSYLADLIYDCLVANGTDKADMMNGDEFLRLMKKQYNYVMDEFE